MVAETLWQRHNLWCFDRPLDTDNILDLDSPCLMQKLFRPFDTTNSLPSGDMIL